MLISILIDIQYLQKPVFSLTKGLIGQNHSSSGSHCQVKKSPPQNFWSPATPYHCLENPLPLERFLIYQKIVGSHYKNAFNSAMVPAHNKKTIKMLIFAIICQAFILLLSGTFSLHHIEKALVTALEELSKIWWQMQVCNP